MRLGSNEHRKNVTSALYCRIGAVGLDVIMCRVALKPHSFNLGICLAS